MGLVFPTASITVTAGMGPGEGGLAGGLFVDFGGGPVAGWSLRHGFDSRRSSGSSTTRTVPWGWRIWSSR
jgi:hypothetical protein